MNSHQFKHIVLQHLKDLGKNAGDISSDFDKDAIHDFRVDAKKIRSFLRLMASQNDSFPMGYNGKFKDVYHTAGYMRDKQVLIDMLNSRQERQPQFTNWLNGCINDQKKIWNDLPVKKALEKLTDKIDNLPFKNLKKQTLKNFFSKGISNVKKIIGKDLVSDEEIHEVRKNLKDLMYVSALCEKEWKEGNELIQAFSPTKIVDLSGIVGEYNDQRIALDILEEYISALPLSEKEAPEQLHQKWQDEKKLQKEKLLLVLHEFIGD